MMAARTAVRSASGRERRKPARPVCRRSARPCTIAQAAVASVRAARVLARVGDAAELGDVVEQVAVGGAGGVLERGGGEVGAVGGEHQPEERGWAVAKAM